MLQVGKYIYVLDIAANTLKSTPDLITWSTVTGLPATSNMMATDGTTIWISNLAGGSGALWFTNTSSSSCSAYITDGSFDGVYWVGERLMVTSGNKVYNIIAGSGTTTPAALWSHPNSNFRISSMCNGSSQIYIAGYDYGGTGGTPLKSTVFRSSIEPNGTALTVPVQALPMAGGEYVTALSSYLNYVFVGTNLGVRMCRTLAAYDPLGAAGDLEAGPALPNLIAPGPVPLPVKAMIANNRFMYFGWSNYDASSTGLGRMDLSTFIDAQTPAYASDMMVTGQGEVVSMDWCTINNQPIWSVSGQGVYTSSGTYVSSGYVDSGFVSYGIPDDKVLMAGDIGTISPQQGTVIMGIGTDANNNAVQAVGQQNSSSSGGTSNQSVFPIAQIRGEQYVVRMTLVRDPVTSKSPILHRWTIKALPAITAGTTISVVLDLFGVANNAGQDTYIDPYAEKAFLENIRKAQLVVPYVEGPYSTLVTIEEIDWLPFKQRDATTEGGYQGDCIVYLKTWDIGS